MCCMEKARKKRYAKASEYMEVHVPRSAHYSVVAMAAFEFLGADMQLKRVVKMTTYNCSELMELFWTEPSTSDRGPLVGISAPCI